MADRPSLPQLPPDAVLAFLKRASIEPTWDVKFASTAMGLNPADAQQVIDVLSAMGYVEQAAGGRKHRWRNTDQGDKAAGAKPPRVRRATAEKAIAALAERIDARHAGAVTPAILQAIAFGQYLSDHDPIDSVDVSIQFEPANADEEHSAPAERIHQAVLKELKARSSALNVRGFAPWMESIPHWQLWPATPGQSAKSEARRTWRGQ